MKKSIRNY